MKPVMYLVRHAESLSRPGTPSEGNGVGLSPKGRQQAQRVARTLAHRGIKRIISSPLARARETAEVIAHTVGVEVEVDDRVREFVASDVTGPAFKQARDHAREDREWIGTGGESFNASVTRLMQVIESLPFGGTTVIVTHELLLQNLLLSLGHPKVPIPHTGILELGKSGGHISIVSVSKRSLLDRIFRLR